jgi:DNA-binding response OmpR family regulator
MRNQMDTSALCRPVVYITVRRPDVRAQIRDALEHQGWTVIEQPTGFHLIQQIADLIDGHPWRVPALIVVDRISPGCSGTTIATGLRELGVATPVVLVEDGAAALIEAQSAAAAVLQEYAGRYVSGSSPARPDKIVSAG